MSDAVPVTRSSNYNNIYVAEIERLRLRLQKAEEVLSLIRDLDFRGNREQGSVIALKYFENKESKE